MRDMLTRSTLIGTIFFAALVAQASAQTPIADTADVTALVSEPHFCEMFVAAPGREDGVSRAYTLGSDKALESLLRANKALSIPQAFAFIQSKCEAKLGSPIAANKGDASAAHK